MRLYGISVFTFISVYAVAAAPSVVTTPLPIDPFKRRVCQSLELTRKVLVDISCTPLSGSDGQAFRTRFSALRDIMMDTRAQLVALPLAFDSVASFVDSNDGIRVAYMEVRHVLLLPIGRFHGDTT